MQQCPNCGHVNRAGVVFCENCGASLIGKMPLETKSLDSSSDQEKAQLGVDASVLKDVSVQGAEVFQEGHSLRLEIEGSPEPILFKPKPETIFGRRDPATGAMPDIDLTPFAGYRMGVSRRHAAIRFGEGQTLELWDLGSSNGTYLSGQRLSAHRPYRLHDGDEIRLGQMVIRLHFQAESGQAPPAKADTTPEASSAAPKADAKPAKPKAPAQDASPAAKPPADKPASAKPTADKPASDKSQAKPPGGTKNLPPEDQKPQPPKPADAARPKAKEAGATDKDKKDNSDKDESKDKPQPPEEK